MGSATPHPASAGSSRMCCPQSSPCAWVVIAHDDGKGAPGVRNYSGVMSSPQVDALFRRTKHPSANHQSPGRATAARTVAPRPHAPETQCRPVDAVSDTDNSSADSPINTAPSHRERESSCGSTSITPFARGVVPRGGRGHRGRSFRPSIPRTPTRPKPSRRYPPTTLGNETADVTPVTFERYPSVSFAVSLPSITHRSPPR